MCPVCGSLDTEDLLAIENIPVYTNVPQASRELALAVASGNIQLTYCPQCSHLFNRQFDSELMAYAPGYEAALDFSPRFREFADALAQSLVERFDIRNKLVIEVACGQGDFLRRICKLGDNQGLGFDPSYLGTDDQSGDQVRIIRDYYSEAYRQHAADFLCSRHALEHIPDPRSFVQQLRSALADSVAPLVYIEVPNSLYTLKDLGIWDLIYEHCSYFSAGSLGQLFQAAGYQVMEIEESFGGQFLGMVARLDTQESAGPATDADPAEFVGRFSARFHAKVSEWQNRLADMVAAGKRVVIWGAGSKAVTFLNVLNTADLVRQVVDINPRKTGLFVPGTGQEIVRPEALVENPPDAVIIMNPIYREEIRGSLQELGLEPEILVA